MKAAKITFWITTVLIFLTEGVMPALTFNSEEARLGLQHLGYPAYFGMALAIFKVLGALTLIIPQIPKSIKEWAYAGFTFNFIFALISHLVIDGVNGGMSLFPLIAIGILAASYISYHKIQAAK